MTDIGYARVSTKLNRNKNRKQHPEDQVKRLLAEGIPRKRIFVDRFEGKWEHRPQWDLCLAALQPGDTLVFTKLDRIGRSVQNLIKVALSLNERGVNMRSLATGEIDTTTAMGKAFFGFMAVLAQFESDMTQERVLEGMEEARERHGGRIPPRGPAKDTAAKLAIACQLLNGGATMLDAAKGAGISRATLYRYLGS